VTWAGIAVIVVKIIIVIMFLLNMAAVVKHSTPRSALDGTNTTARLGPTRC